MKITKKLLSILLVTTLMLTLLPATAQAAAAPKVKITWNANGGSVTPALRKVAYKKGYGTLPTPTRSGYTFDGWYTAASGGTKVKQVCCKTSILMGRTIIKSSVAVQYLILIWQ